MNLRVSFAAFFRNFDAVFPVAVKTIFSLMLVKFISEYGSAGALSTWGAVQNVTVALAAVLSLSVQGGIAANIANSSDLKALGRAVSILICTTMLGLVVCFVSYVYDSAYLPRFAFLFVLSAFLVSIGNFMATYFPLIGKTCSLGFYYVITGSVCFVLMFFLVDFSQFYFLICLFFSGLVGALFVWFSVKKDFSLVPFYNKENRPRTLSLMRFGVASIVNTTVVMSASIYLRDFVVDGAGSEDADLFESGLRLISLMEASVGAVVGILLWKRSRIIFESPSYVTRYVLYSVFLGFVGYWLFLGFGEYIITMIFSEKFQKVVSYSGVIFLIGFVKIVYSVVVMPIYLKGKVRYLILSDILFLITILFAKRISGSSDFILTSYYSLLAGVLVSLSTVLLVSYFFLKGRSDAPGC